ncbi:WW domain-binding protein 1-like isoform X1 [Sinocyclocheilus rhinocerous]|uniref:WW domain-binding protein 1-like n=1 Tax=Sinocyclocheilus rhinocerous TaxID=307959 RepID=A0A673M100_9TELE|nr:PREDICTED: WW domain-binding protein 1-like isoform X1 [Sinocyclocheilus rhinocerous]
MPQKLLGSVVGLLCTGACLVKGKEFCFGVNNEQYRCEMGYCCGETECCTYYYELWWFWLVWSLIIMLSCCCAYRHRRVKMRLQQEQRQREISLMAYQGASSSFITPPPPPPPLNLRFWTDCKLPDYEEVMAHPPTPPPPYSPPEQELETQETQQEREEPSGRRRHVTGDSGIEVCVCQLDEGLGPEEEALCQGPGVCDQE